MGRVGWEVLILGLDVQRREMMGGGEEENIMHALRRREMVSEYLALLRA